ncbi:MAG: DNA topoisomerase-1, partial [Pseudohongiellaceae bacterium]
PYVAEILPHKEEIDPKYDFLFKAPVEDDDGNKALIRFSRKTKEQYVQTEVDKKATGWKAFYEGGAWVISKPEKKAAKKKVAVKKKAAVKKKKVAKKKAVKKKVA